MNVGDLVCLCPFTYPDAIGVVTQILIRDQHGEPLDIEVLHNGQIGRWEADEAEVINESR